MIESLDDIVLIALVGIVILAAILIFLESTHRISAKAFIPLMIVVTIIGIISVIIVTVENYYSQEELQYGDILGQVSVFLALCVSWYFAVKQIRREKNLKGFNQKGT